MGRWSNPENWFGFRLFNRWPLVCAVIAASVGAFAFTIASFPVTDPDVWWVAAAGRDMLATGHVPTLNAYSFTAPMYPWVMHEWLLGPPYAWGLQSFGPMFFSAAAICTLGLSCAAVLHATTHPALRPFTAITASVLVLFFFGARFFSVRPLTFGLLCTAWMIVLAFGRTFTTGHIVAAVLFELLWTNIHGSFPAGVALLFASAFAGDRELARKRIIAAVLAGAVTFINPYGWELHHLVWRYLTNDFAFVSAHVIEFSPLWAPRDFPFPHRYVGLAVLALLTLSALRTPGYRVRALVCVAFGYLAVTHIRHVEQFGLVATMLLVPHLDERLGRAGFARHENMHRSTAPLREVLVRWRTALLVLPGCVFGLAVLGSKQLPSEKWIGADLGGAEFVGLASHLPKDARVYAPFGSSGLLIWLGAPRGARVFFDPRNDCYPIRVAKAAVALEHERLTAHDAASILERHGTELVLVNRSHPLTRLLRGVEGYRVEKRTQNWTLFAVPTKAATGRSRGESSPMF